MKHLYLPLFLILSFLISCSTGSNDLDRAGLKGKVKSYKELQFEATYENDKWVAGEPVTYGGRIVNYDEDGFYTESISVSTRGDTLGISRSKRVDGELVEDVFYSTYDRRTTRTIMERVSSEQINFEVWQDEQLIPSARRTLGARLPRFFGFSAWTCAIIFSVCWGNTVTAGAWHAKHRVFSSPVGLVWSHSPRMVLKTGEVRAVPCNSAPSTRPNVLRSGVCSRIPFHSS